MTFTIIHRGIDYATAQIQSKGLTYQFDVALSVADEIERIKEIIVKVAL
jgi:hypothetical protein